MTIRDMAAHCSAHGAKCASIRTTVEVKATALANNDTTQSTNVSTVTEQMHSTALERHILDTACRQSKAHNSHMAALQTVLRSQPLNHVPALRST